MNLRKKICTSSSFLCRLCQHSATELKFTKLLHTTWWPTNGQTPSQPQRLESAVQSLWLRANESDARWSIVCCCCCYIWKTFTHDPAPFPWGHIRASTWKRSRCCTARRWKHHGTPSRGPGCSGYQAYGATSTVCYSAVSCGRSETMEHIR